MWFLKWKEKNEALFWSLVVLEGCFWYWVAVKAGGYFSGSLFGVRLWFDGMIK